MVTNGYPPISSNTRSRCSPTGSSTGVDPVEDWREVVITPPTRLVGGHAVLDIGNRAVELIHLGRGHTDNDLLVHVPDTGLWLVGDLVEESGPPMYGSGSFPLDWPQTVGRLLSRLSEDHVVVPGHGAPVDRSFIERQRADLQTAADLIRELHAAGLDVQAAAAEAIDRWPFPPDGLRSAVVDGYRQLDRQPN